MGFATDTRFSIDPLGVNGFDMYPALKIVPPPSVAPISSDDRDIRDFLIGRTDGEDVLHALYDHILDEPVPERLLALLRR